MTYLADITEPDVGQGAGSLAVDALELVLSNDHVAQGCSVLQDEHGTVGAYSISFIHLDLGFYVDIPVSSSLLQGRPRSYSLLPRSTLPLITLGEGKETMSPTRLGMLRVWALARPMRPRMMALECILFG